MNSIKVKDLELGKTNDVVLISGPCSVEDRETTIEIAKRIKDLADENEIPFIFKASYDKANRTDKGGYRGQGFQEGLSILSYISDTLKIPVTSDVHSFDEIDDASSVIDLLQVPAALCKQIDFVISLAQSGKPVNIKKGHFVSSWEMNNVLNRLKEKNLNQLMITERGNFFGYQTMVTDFRNISILKQYGFPVFYDAGHAQQLPTGIEKAMMQYNTKFTGPSDFVGSMACAGIASGADGIFMMSHIDRSKALSCADVTFNIENLKPLVKKLKRIRKAINED